MGKYLKRLRPKNDIERIVWATIKDVEFFSYADVIATTTVPEKSLRVLLSQLHKKGHTRIHHSKGNQVFFTTQSIEGVLAGGTLARKIPEGATWTAIRLIGEFVIADLVAGIAPSRPDVTSDFITAYCEMLRRAGFVMIVRKASPGSGRSAVFRLIKNTGPLPPSRGVAAFISSLPVIPASPLPTQVIARATTTHATSGQT